MQDGFVTAANGQVKRHALSAARKIIVFDFDGVLNTYGGLNKKQIEDLYARNKLLAVREVYPNWEISDEKIVAVGAKSYKETGDGKLLYADFAVAEGLIQEHEKEEYREKMLRSFHKHMLADVRKTIPIMLNRDEELIELFRKLKPHFTFGILTQSCKHNWVIPILEEMGLMDFFNPEHIQDFKDTDFQLKAKKIKPLCCALSSMGAMPENVIFVEDSEPNLGISRQFLPDVLNAYIGNKENLDGLAHAIDYVSTNLKDFLTKISLLFSKPAPQQQNGLNYDT